MAVSTLKRCCALGLALAAAAALCSCGGRYPVPDRPTVESSERQFTAPAEGDTIAIFTTSLGEVRAVLYPDAAPMAVYNFAGLARSGYYDDTVIWRSQYGFAVQGGDAEGTGTGGAPSTTTAPSRWRRTRACATMPGRCAWPPWPGMQTAAAASFTLSPRCPTAWTRRCSPS